MVKWKAAGSVALVTGASSGIGKHLATQLCAQGATIIATARRQERLKELQDQASRWPGSIIPEAGDITDPDFQKRLIDRVQRQFGRLDLLANNAGIGGIGPFADASPDRLRQIMEVNFFAPVELVRIALPLLTAGRAPVICNVCSVLGHRAVPGKSEYCASKFAIHGWSDSLRSELADTGIQVTLVSPSTTASEFFDSVIDTKASDSGRRESAMSAEKVAMKTIGAIKRRRDEVVLSAGGKALVYADRLWPWLMNRILAKFG